MLTIHKPEIIQYESNAILRAVFECGNTKEYLWFSTPTEYGRYLCHERADAFLVPLLLYAMKRHQDIRVLAPVSERLLYTLSTYMVPVLHSVYPEYKHINISCEQLTNSALPNAGAIGTGISCGIDSLFTIAEHCSDNCLPGYRLTHLTFFNSGSNGRLEENASLLFEQRLRLVRAFALELELPLVTLESNCSDLLDMPYESVHTYCNIACVIAFQKLFGVYYYSSGYSIHEFEITRDKPAYFDTYILDMLSADKLKFFSSGTTHNRVEKTKVVIEYKPSYKYLNVCTRTAENCSTCPKCLRTLLTIDLLGKLELYKDVFNLKSYAKLKDKYIANVLATRNSNKYSQEIYELIQTNRMKKSIKTMLLYQYYLFREKVSKIPGSPPFNRG